MKKIKKILIIRLGAIGDVVHSSIMSQAIKQKHPDVEIHFLTSEICAPLIQNDPNLTKVHVFEMAKKNNFFYLLKLALGFCCQRFDVIINLSNAIRNYFISILAFPNKIIPRKKGIHAVDAFFNTAKEAICDIEKPLDLKLYLSDDANSKIKDKIKDYPRPYIAISPGGENDKQREGRIWPLQNWLELSNKLIDKFGGTIFVVGSKAEKEYHSKLVDIKNCVVFPGELELDESAALFAYSDLVISGDSGPLHIASALDVKTLGLMGSTSALKCGPYGTKCYAIDSSSGCRGICSRHCSLSLDNPYKPCMLSITPDDVEAFIESKELLN